jgi:hypothetical protein
MWKGGTRYSHIMLVAEYSVCLWHLYLATAKQNKLISIYLNLYW